MTATVTAPRTVSPSLCPVETCDNDFDRLRLDQARMLRFARAALADALGALLSGDLRRARAVIEADGSLAAWTRDGEARAFRLAGCADKTPNTVRRVAASLRIGTHIERIGDHAVHIARFAERLPKSPVVSPVPIEIERMASLALCFLETAVRVVERGDTRFADDDLSERDAELDVLWGEAQTELRTRMREMPEQGVAASHLLFVAHALERIGDHCVSIAERVG